MTAEEDSTEVSSGERSFGRFSTFTRRGLLESQRERGEDVQKTPDSKRKVFGAFFSSPKTPAPATTPAVEPEASPSSTKSSINKFLTPSKTFVRLKNEKEELSKLTPSPPSYGLHVGGLNLPLVGEVKFKTVLDYAKNWLRNPKNIALLIWGTGVAVSGAILFMVMVGMLNAVIPSRDARNTWFEVSNQIINALFTLMALYLHPQRCMNLRMLIRWNPSDIIKLRRIYCKDGLRKPHEWGHMLVVVLLLHLNCIAQYCLCGLNWGYRRAQRPAIGVAICLCTSFGAGAAAGVYNSVSPLGKDFLSEAETEDLEEGKLKGVVTQSEFIPRTRIYRILEKRVSFAYRDEGSLVDRPEWKGGVCDITNERTVCVFTALCSFCVFGWNMDRLGFGNRYVHIVTFIIFCTAPFWIFDLAALNIQNHDVRNAIGATGIVLCALGLFYGGYWRIQMRERFKLPGNTFCCGKPSVTDCFQWLFLPLCSLCQEVRTAEFYDVKDDRFYSRGRMGPNSPPSPSTPGPPFVPGMEAPSHGVMSRDEVELAPPDFQHRGHDRQHRRSPLGPATPPSPLGQPSSSEMASDAANRLSIMSSDASPARAASPRNTNGITLHAPNAEPSGADRFPSADVASDYNYHFSYSPSNSSQLRSPSGDAVSSQQKSLEGDNPTQSFNAPSFSTIPLDGLRNDADRDTSSGSDNAIFQPSEGGRPDKPLPSKSEIEAKSS